MIIKIHLTWFIGILYMFINGNLELFFCYYMFILMHELAHMITAIILDVDISEISLLPMRN